MDTDAENESPMDTAAQVVISDHKDGGGDDDASSALYEKYQSLVLMHEQNYANFKSTSTGQLDWSI